MTQVISLGMSGFDLLAMGIGFFDPDNALVKLNQELHSSALYNGFQLGVSALAIFTTGATSTMACFIAGTMILTAAGLVAIENIKAGDKVVSTNADTFETAEKTVVEIYIREVPQLVHLTVNGELISTTVDHPFYVKDVGFVNAGELYVGDKIVNASGDTYSIEIISCEIVDKPVTVYNFQVEDFHTYHVGNLGVLVHNADYLPTENSKGFIKRVDNKDGSITITKRINGNDVDVTYTREPQGDLRPHFEPYAHPDHPAPIKVEGMNGRYGHDASLANTKAN